VIGNEAIEFQARFSGVTENIYVPIGAVTAIYARETGAGMGFEAQASDSVETKADSNVISTTLQSESPDDDGPKPTESKRPKLSIVK